MLFFNAENWTMWDAPEAPSINLPYTDIKAAGLEEAPGVLWSWVLKMLKDRNSIISLGCLFQCLATWCEIFFPYIQSEFPFLHLLPLVLSLFASGKSLAYVQLVYQLSAMLLLSHSAPSQYCCTECPLSEVEDCIFLYWISWGSCQLIPPTCQDPFGWQHSLPVYWLLHLVWCHL